MPIMPQTIHAGKNDPRILNEGAREHPAANSTGTQGCSDCSGPLYATATQRGEVPVNVSIHLAVSFGGIGLRPFRMEQVASLES